MNYPEQVLTRVPPSQRKVIAALRSLIRKVVPEARETLLWDSLSYHRSTVGGRVKGAVCLITPKPDAVHLGFIHGAALADPDHLLQGSRKSKRYIPVRRLDEIEVKSLSDLLRAAARYRPD